MAMEFLVKGKITYTNQYFCLHKKNPHQFLFPNDKRTLTCFVH